MLKINRRVAGLVVLLIALLAPLIVYVSPQVFRTENKFRKRCNWTFDHAAASARLEAAVRLERWHSSSNSTVNYYHAVFKVRTLVRPGKLQPEA
jgi:hypothetical protein